MQLFVKDIHLITDAILAIILLFFIYQTFLSNLGCEISSNTELKLDINSITIPVVPLESNSNKISSEVDSNENSPSTIVNDQSNDDESIKFII